jgi:hypothetical protein
VLNGIDGESAQAVAQVAPGVEVPVVAVVDQAVFVNVVVASSVF